MKNIYVREINNLAPMVLAYLFLSKKYSRSLLCVVWAILTML